MPLTRTSAPRRSFAKGTPARAKQPSPARKPTAKNERLISRVPQRESIGLPKGSTILALDPGGATGVAVRFPDGTVRTVTVRDPLDLWEYFVQRPDFVVFETFATGGRVDKYMIYTIELVGGVKAACAVLGLRGFPHPPQKRYPWLAEAEAILKGLEHTRHEVDALAHLLAFEAVGAR